MEEIELKENKYKKIAAISSLVVGTLIMVSKFAAYRLTGSLAVFSDALESIVNVVAAALTLFVIYYAAKPIDDDHPYGHGKVEYFSEAFEGGLITFAAIFIVIEAMTGLIHGTELQLLDAGMVIVVLAGVANLILGISLIRVGKKHKSIALKASGHHVISDFWTSLGIIVGLFLVKITGLNFLDSLCALLVGLYLGYTGVGLVKESIGGLMDMQDDDLLSKLANVFAKYATGGIIQVHHAKIIRSGNYHHIDAHLVVPENWTIDKVHDHVSEFEEKVLGEYGFQGELNYHLDPCRKVYCKVCDVQNCPIRTEKFVKKINVNIDHLKNKEEPEEYRED